MVKQARAARTRESLIRAAAEVFAQDGFALASLAAISKRAGVSNGALHFHFESKSALARAVEEQAMEAVRRITEQAAARAGGPLQALVEATHALMTELSGNGVLRAGFALGGDASRGGGAALRREWQRWVEGVLRQARREGLLAEGVSPDGAASAIVAATVGFEVLGSTDRKWLSEQVITQFWGLLLPRLAGGGQPGELRPTPAAGE
ncbi:ScbR family autoregulator-binding transcription factor [Streptomyces cacaoi]|uniref:ScbR family autoregulator-binding transcription factor n=1 Tax=Streptomyces cacaoi TaxID=1898 RepID=UPI002623FE06|nr:ScbR family autoregulator-binding transcription factor [Streptomyces cacaoi]